MTKETKKFRIIISILLILTMLFSAFFAFLFCVYISKEAEYGFYVDNVAVTRGNKDDVLGDGTVYYDANNNILTFDNATIETENWPVYSNIDLNIELIGENKFVCNSEEYSAGVYAGDYQLSKDLAFIGDGSLTIEIPNKSGEAVGIFASDLTVTTDIIVKTPDCEKQVHGIVCDSSLIVANKAAVTVNTGAAKNTVGVRVRGNALFEEGTAMNVTVNPGTTEMCKGLNVSGDVFLGKDTTLEVLVDDESTDLGECIRVSGLMEIGRGSTLTASAKTAYAIECFGSIEAKTNAVVSAVSDEKEADIFCSGAVVIYGADIDAEIDAIGGIRNKAEN